MRRWLPLLLAFGACSPFASDSADTPGPVMDAGGGADAATGTDAAVADSASPAVMDVEAGPGGPRVATPITCGTISALQCDDFADAKSATGWTGYPQNAVTTYEVGSDSHGGVAVITLYPDAGPPPGEERFHREVALETTDRRTLNMDLSLRIDALAPNQVVEIVKLTAHDTVDPQIINSYLVRLEVAASSDGTEALVKASAFDVENNKDFGVLTVVGKITNHEWHHIHFDLTVGGGQDSVYSAGVDTYDITTIVVPPEHVQTVVRGVDMVVGLSHLNFVTGTSRLVFDDIVLTQL